ncbi:MAG: hypothetical protein U0637_08910 [Phycisphaerales bacterium]
MVSPPAAPVARTNTPPAPPPSDPDLAAVVAAWATLPTPIRAAVMAMVRSVGGGS